ncbi:MAG: PAS domain S-box protein [Candidatus Methanofastidiosum sp.]|nr:PAS domain S-box protein [Methanofastidiosum sp.]
MDTTDKNIPEKEEIVSHKKEFLESIIETANAIILTWDNDTTITSFNTYGKKILGYSNEDVLGKKWLEFIPPDIKPYMKGVSEKIISGEDLYWDHENTWLCKDGSIKYILWRNSPIKDENGNIVFYISVGVDITERKKTEELLVDAEKKFRTLFDSANDAIFIHDYNGNFLEVNETASQRLGYAKSELRSMRVNDIEPAEYHNYILKRIQKISENKSLFYETTHITKNGKRIPVELSSRIIELDKRPYILCIARDITERKRAEDEMKRQLMKFRLEDGNIYTVQELTPTISLEAFKDLQKIGYESVVISRATEKEFQKYFNGNYKYLWFHEEGHNGELFNLRKIEKYILNLPRKSVILLDRIDYLLAKYNFKNTLNFFQNIRDLAYLNDLVILVPIDPQLVNEKELRYLKKDTKEIELRYGKTLSEDLLEILRFVYGKNKSGYKPSFSDIGVEFNITRPTIKKRIDKLSKQII